MVSCATVNNINQARALQISGNNDEAIAAYYLAIRENPERLDIRVELAKLLLEKDLLPAAREVLEGALTLKPDNNKVKAELIKIYLAQGLRYKKAGQLTNAYEIWQKVLSIDEKNTQASNFLENLYISDTLKQSVNTPEVVPSQPERENKDVNRHRDKGMAYYQQGKWEKALHEFQYILKLSPYDAKTYNNLGSVYLRLNKLSEADAAFEQAVSLNPNLVEIYNNWGNVFFRQGNYYRARELWQRSLALDQQNKKAHKNLDMLTNLGY